MIRSRDNETVCNAGDRLSVEKQCQAKTMELYTKNGHPLQVSGETVYSASGSVVGRIRAGKVFGPDGRYVGTVVGDRLIYRSPDSPSISSAFSVANRAGCGKAHREGSALWGDEPDIAK